MPQTKVSHPTHPSLIESVHSLRATGSDLLTNFEMLVIEACERIIARSDPECWPFEDLYQDDCVDLRASISKLVCQRQQLDSLSHSINHLLSMAAESPCVDSNLVIRLLPAIDRSPVCEWRCSMRDDERTWKAKCGTTAVNTERLEDWLPGPLCPNCGRPIAEA